MAKNKRLGRPTKKTEPPTCNCVLLCDDVLVSHAKGKHYLQGIIGVIVVPQLPATIGGYMAYVRVSNVYGTQKLRVSLDHGGSGEHLFAMEVQLPDKQDPLGLFTVVAKLPPFEVTEEGRYMFSAWSDGVQLAQSPIKIQTFKPPKMEGSSNEQNRDE